MNTTFLGLTLCHLLHVFTPADSAKPNPCATSVYTTNENDLTENPVYTPDDQAIFWASPTAGPGKWILVKGAFTGSPLDVDLQAIPSGTHVPLHAQDVDPTGFSVQVPPEFPDGEYVLTIRQTRLRARINQPKVYWTMGLGEDVNPSGASTGDSLHVIGINFPLTGNLLWTDAGGNTQAMPYQTMDSHTLSVGIPPSLAPGSYALRVSPSATPDLLASDTVMVTITARPPGHLPEKDVACNGLSGDGSTDNTSALQGCLDHYATSGNTVRVHLPAGNYLFSKALTLHPNEYLLGAGPGKTILTAAGGNVPIPDFWITGTHHFGLEHLSVIAPIKTAIVGNYLNHYTYSTHTGNEGFVLLHDLVLQSVPGNLPAGNTPPAIAQLGGPHLRITYVTADITQLVAHDRVGFNLIPADGGYFYGNKILLGEGGDGAYVYSYHDVLFENNLIQGIQTTDRGATSGMSVVTARILGSANNMLVYHNRIENILSNDREAVTTDLGGGAYYGPVASASGSETTLQFAPNWGGNPTENGRYLIAITSGRGMGQFRTINSVDGQTVHMESPWTVMPDAHSIVSIFIYHQHLELIANSVENAGHLQFYGGVVNSSISENVMHNAMGVRLYSGIYFCACQPLENIMVLSNQLTGTANGDVKRHFGIQMFARNTTAISGVLIRDNQLPSSGNIDVTSNPKRMKPALISNNAGDVQQTAAKPRGILLH